MSIEQYKKSVLAACELYQQEIKSKSKIIHPVRLKDLNIFQDLIRQINNQPLLELKIKEHLLSMTTRGRFWTLYILAIGDSRLKQLVEVTLNHFSSESETEYLKKSLQYYETELEKRDLRHKKDIESLQNDHTLLLNMKDKQYNDEINYLKQHITSLLEENLTLKEMIAKQSEIIKQQLDQILNLSLSEKDTKNLAIDKAVLSKEITSLKESSVFQNS